MSGTLLAYIVVVVVIVGGTFYLTFHPTRQNADGSMTRGKKIICAIVAIVFVVLFAKLGITGK